MGRAGLDVAAAFAIGAGLRAASALAARQAVELAFDPARGERFADLDLLAPLPPAGVERLVRRLTRRLDAAALLFILLLLIGC